MLPGRIEAVVFDIDDTLIDFRASAAAGLAHLLGDQVRDGLAPFWHELTERHYPRFLAGEVAFTEMQLERLAELLAWAGLAVPDREGLLALEAGRQRAMEQNYRLFDDVRPCLDALSSYRLGALSNSDGPHQRAKLAGVGLADAFEVVVISGDVGFPKPDPRIFAEACRRLDLPAERVAYVGDRWDIDANAAARAGLLGVWLDRSVGPPGATAALNPGVRFVTALDQLPVLLQAC